jgi:6-pyruvoyltetrahydropterin/6-carboxytetrahydropterin synthase
VIRLRRSIRFCLTDPATFAADMASGTNGFAGKPSMQGIAPHGEVEVSCVGEPDPIVNYVLDIKDIDDAVRTILLPPLAAAAAANPQPPVAAVLRDWLIPLGSRLFGRVESVTLKLTPTHSLAMNTASPDRVLLRQQFDFAAAHRLHTPSLSDEENRRRYGKCNNPRGHGHNYKFEPCVEMQIDPSLGSPLSLHDLEAACKRAIIDRFDHTHLNEDTTEFDLAKGGVIPTIENISRVLFDLLGRDLAATAPRVRLVSMTAWETDRTSATYPA